MIPEVYDNALWWFWTTDEMIRVTEGWEKQALHLSVDTSYKRKPGWKPFVALELGLNVLIINFILSLADFVS